VYFWSCYVYEVFVKYKEKTIFNVLLVQVVLAVVCSTLVILWMWSLELTRALTSLRETLSTPHNARQIL